MRFFLLLCVCVLYLKADAHIFLYHRFNDDRYPSTSVSNDELRKQFQYLKDNGYEIVPLEKIVKKIADNEKMPNNWIALTIDDGYKSFLQNGLEIFKEFGYPFTLFVYAEAAEKKYPDFMSWSELKSLLQENGSLEFHSYSHTRQTKLDEEKLKNDFQKGLTLFEKHLGIAPKYFSYPYGEFDDNVRKTAKTFGFEAIFNQNSGAIDSKSDIYDLPRSALTSGGDIKRLLKQKTLQAEWISPLSFPKDGILSNVRIATADNALNAKLYITGEGWIDVSLNKGVLNKDLNIKLTNQRTRLILKIGDKTSTKLLVK
jgi:peptidoglycan/xylan/chitin deacetylase (PgdA/CDA1 family)